MIKKPSPRQLNQLTYLAVGLAAIVVRIGVLFELRGSPLQAFHLIPGLDMASHVELGRHFAVGNSIFTVYRFLLGTLPLAAIAPLQAAAGTATALLVVYCSFRLFGRRLYALAAGLLAALYAPAVLYETAILQESVTVLIGFAAFAALLYARKRHCAAGAMLLCGAALGLAGTGRPVALPFIAAALLWQGFYLRRIKHRSLRPLLFTVAGLAAVWLAVGAYNQTKSWPLPFYGGNIAYMATVGETANPTSWNMPEAAKERSLLRRAANIGGSFCLKLPRLFSVRELPDNLNYYFIRERFAPLAMLPGPVLLMPLAAAGLLLMLGTGRIRRREGLIWLYTGAMMLFIVAYFPSGRHRLMLYPALALAAVYPLHIWQKCRNLKKREAIGILLLAVFAVNFIATPDPRVNRIGDFFTWGLALEKTSNATEDAADSYLIAALSDQRNRQYAIHYANLLIRERRWAELGEFLSRINRPGPVHGYYYAIWQFAEGNPKKAADTLRRIDPDDLPEFRVPYYYYLGESLRLTGRPEEAAAALADALRFDTAMKHRAVIDQARNRIAPPPSPPPAPADGAR
jgi:hypothetical protein